MEVRSGCPAGSSTQTNLLTFLYPLAFGDLDSRQVHVQSHELLAVVDDHAIAFVEKLPSQYNRPGIRCQDGRPLLRVIIQTAMNAGELAVEGAPRPECLRHGGVYWCVERP